MIKTNPFATLNYSIWTLILQPVVSTLQFCNLGWLHSQWYLKSLLWIQHIVDFYSATSAFSHRLIFVSPLAKFKSYLRSNRTHPRLKNIYYGPSSQFVFSKSQIWALTYMDYLQKFTLMGFQKDNFYTKTPDLDHRYCPYKIRQSGSRLERKNLSLYDSFSLALQDKISIFLTWFNVSFQLNQLTNTKYVFRLTSLTQHFPHHKSLESINSLIFLDIRKIPKSRFRNNYLEIFSSLSLFLFISTLNSKQALPKFQKCLSSSQLGSSCVPWAKSLTCLYHQKSMLPYEDSIYLSFNSINNNQKNDFFCKQKLIISYLHKKTTSLSTIFLIKRKIYWVRSIYLKGIFKKFILKLLKPLKLRKNKHLRLTHTSIVTQQWDKLGSLSIRSLTTNYCNRSLTRNKSKNKFKSQNLDTLDTSILLQQKFSHFAKFKITQTLNYKFFRFYSQKLRPYVFSCWELFLCLISFKYEGLRFNLIHQ